MSRAVARTPTAAERVAARMRGAADFAAGRRPWQCPYHAIPARRRIWVNAYCDALYTRLASENSGLPPFPVEHHLRFGVEWSDAEVDFLTRATTLGIPYPVQSAVLGRLYRGVTGKAQRCGIGLRRSGPTNGCAAHPSEPGSSAVQPGTVYHAAKGSNAA